MAERETMEVTITNDMDKLWRCENMLKRHPEKVGVVPPCAGKKIRVFKDSVAPSPFCDSPISWLVVPEDYIVATDTGDRRVCEHQVERQAQRAEDK